MSKIDRIIRRNQARRKQPKYSCVYISGDSAEHEGGIWRKQDRPQTITFVCIKKPFFELDWEKLIIHKDPKKNKHPIKDWQDGSYTIYPYQCGTPYIFTPITRKEQISEYRKKYRAKYYKDCPWATTRIRIVTRCGGKNQPYHKKGIKNFLTTADLKFLWFRDKAFLLNKASIDRIDPKLDYTLENCRYMERSENCALGNINRKREVYSKNGRFS